ncbi:MAG: hypothetical protein ABI683_01745 [Ginsengibacter sp.]
MKSKKIITVVIFIFVVFNSCKKASDLVDNPLLQQYFETNVLNRDFTVSLATDSTTDLTPDYGGYIFVLLKTDYYHGPLKATKAGIVYTGTWSSNEDYSRLDITLPVPPDEFIFLNRAWRFTSKGFPTMKLAPWGSTKPLVLNMYRQ